MINSSKTRLSRLNGDFEFSAYGYRFAPHTSAAVPASAESAKRHPIRIGSSQNAGRPTELGARTWAIALASALFFFAVGAALGQQAATTPTQAEKELEIKKEGGQTNGTRPPEETCRAGKTQSSAQIPGDCAGY
jgi:hypothetical protein